MGYRYEEDPYDYDHEGQFSPYDRDEEEMFEPWDCLFGERCCMPGMHTRDECHTAEMAEEWMSAEA